MLMNDSCTNAKYRIEFDDGLFWRVCTCCNSTVDMFIIPDHIPKIQRSRYAESIADREGYRF